MAKAQELVDRVADYLADRMSLEELEDWSASFLRDVHPDGDAQTVGYLVRSILNAYEGDTTEVSVRRELENAIRPFRYCRVAENRYGDPSFLPSPETNAESESNRAAA